MEQRGWARRLDDRADSMLKRRFGFGLIDDPERSLRQELRRNLLLAGLVTAILVVALVVSGQSERVPVVLGPLVGVGLGTVAGRSIRERRKAK